ncbi:P-II family nitrogen regulator [Spirochaetota bacterium]
MLKPENGLVLFCSIHDFGQGSKILKLSANFPCIGETIIIGKGSVRKHWLNMFGIIEKRKEIFVSILDKGREEDVFTLVKNEFEMDKAHKGIAFSIPLNRYYDKGDNKLASKGMFGGGKMKYESIFVIANKDLQDDILDAAEAGGSTGGTVIHGRGSGTQEKAVLFNIEIEPEKVIVLILAKTDKSDAIIKSVSDKLNIHEPNAGIIFTMPVSKTLGLYEK